MWVQFSSRNICDSLNGNQNTIRYHLTSVRLAIIKKNLQTKPGEDVEKRELSCTIRGNVNWYRHYGEQYGDSLEN